MLRYLGEQMGLGTLAKDGPDMKCDNCGADMPVCACNVSCPNCGHKIACTDH